MDTGRTRLPAATRVRVLLRAFLLQASWNFERMQSLGLLYALTPALRRLYRSGELVRACRRHLEYFNTHPFLASPVLGAILALEEGQRRGEATEPEVEEFKRMVMAPCAAIGDAFFWGGVRPLAAGVALLLAFAGSLWAPVVFLALFNLPHLWVRVAGLRYGYGQGARVVETLQHYRLPDLAVRLKQGTVLLLGGVCAWLTVLCLGAQQLAPWWGAAVLPGVALVAWLARRGASALLLALGVAALLLALAGG